MSMETVRWRHVGWEGGREVVREACREGGITLLASAGRADGSLRRYQIHSHPDHQRGHHVPDHHPCYGAVVDLDAVIARWTQTQTHKTG